MQPTEVLNKLLSVLQIVEEQKCEYASRRQSANQIISQKTTELFRTQELLNLERQVLNLETAAREGSNRIVSEKDNQLLEKEEVLELMRIEKKEMKEVLLHTLNKCSPNPMAFICHHFLDKPHLRDLQKNITDALENFADADAERPETRLLPHLPLEQPPHL